MATHTLSTPAACADFPAEALAAFSKAGDEFEAALAGRCRPSREMVRRYNAAMDTFVDACRRRGAV